MSLPEITNDWTEDENEQKTPKRYIKSIFLTLVIGVLSFGAIFFSIKFLLLTPPTNFPVGETVTVTTGSSAKSVAELMKDKGFASSELALYFSILWWHNPSTIKATTYRFDKPLSAKQLANELTRGHFANDLVKLTLIEGERSDQIAKRAEAVLINFDTATFMALAKPVEGKLFPDTYLLPASYTAKDLFTLLTKTYQEKITPLKTAITESTLTEEEILILASIVEREANTVESMRLVSGILQTRLKIGMALQVDASLEYVLEKPLSELSPEDLEQDSPYNTYKNAGLPPTAIGNPGLEAIKAVLDPEISSYLFYITGNDGNFYYAETFDEHRLNIARYLR